MAKGFTIARNEFPDNTTHAAFATAVKEWMDALSIGTNDTVYEISCEHLHGFWVIVVIYEE